MRKNIKTHRCKALLEHNKSPISPVSIVYKNKEYPYDERYKKLWALRHLEWDPEDWDIKYMQDICEIKFCPFCGRELKIPER